MNHQDIGFAKQSVQRHILESGRVTGGAMAGVGLSVPGSPLEARLNTMEGLVEGLASNIGDLINRIRPVLAHDPREAPIPSSGTTSVENPSVSPLDDSLAAHIARLSSRVHLLGDVIQAVRL